MLMDPKYLFYHLFFFHLQQLSSKKAAILLLSYIEYSWVFWVILDPLAFHKGFILAALPRELSANQPTSMLLINFHMNNTKLKCYKCKAGSFVAKDVCSRKKMHFYFLRSFRWSFQRWILKSTTSLVYNTVSIRY